MHQDITVASDTPMPKGYRFLHKGNRYKTRHGRKLTHESGKPLYIVIDKKEKMGLRVPGFVYEQVQSQASQTLLARRAATQKRDTTENAKVAAEIDLQFPRMPKEEKERILKHGFRKHSGRVGRTSAISLKKKVLLAVIAHVRHKHTTYDALLNDGKTKEAARDSTRRAVDARMHEWGLKRTSCRDIRRGKKKASRNKTVKKVLKTA